jgi:cell division protein FtsB
LILIIGCSLSLLAFLLYIEFKEMRQRRTDQVYDNLKTDIRLDELHRKLNRIEEKVKNLNEQSDKICFEIRELKRNAKR